MCPLHPGNNTWEDHRHGMHNCRLVNCVKFECVHLMCVNHCCVGSIEFLIHVPAVRCLARAVFGGEILKPARLSCGAASQAHTQTVQDQGLGAGFCGIGNILEFKGQTMLNSLSYKGFCHFLGFHRVIQSLLPEYFSTLFACEM